MDLQELPGFYRQLDSRYRIVNGDLDSATYTNVESNFTYSAGFARHRWFHYKEGFSPVLVERLLDECCLDRDSVVCDPFCGAGTTLAVAKARGMRSYGFEVNPFAAFITRVKTAGYTPGDMEEFQGLLAGLGEVDPAAPRPLPENEYLRRIFAPEMLTVQLNLRAHLNSLPEGRARELLYFAWLCTLEDCSLYRKAGNGLKKKLHPPAYEEGGAFPFALELVRRKAASMLEDYSPEEGPLPELYNDSATTLKERLPRDSVDLVLFSPPYANCFDYTKIYYLELWFGGFVVSAGDQKAIRMRSLRSHCHATWPERYTGFRLPPLHDELLPLLRQQPLWTKRIPDMLSGYFADMEEVLRQVYGALREGGRCAIVVSNSAYAGIVVPTDAFLAEIAERLGFRVREIEVQRLIITSSQQYQKTQHLRRYLRESIVKLEK